jgi:hypothetical protein
MDPDKPNAKIDSDAADSTDHTEQRAAELAETKGQSRTTDEDRKKAVEEMKATSQPAEGLKDEEASH